MPWERYSASGSDLADCVLELQIWNRAIICVGHKKTKFEWKIHINCKTVFEQDLPVLQNKKSVVCPEIFSEGTRIA